MGQLHLAEMTVKREESATVCEPAGGNRPNTPQNVDAESGLKTDLRNKKLAGRDAANEAF
jgi:hypothetical protein